MPTFSSMWYKKLGAHLRAVIKSWGLGIFPGYYEHGPQLLSKKKRRKLEPKEIFSCLIPFLLVVFTQQLEFLVTALAHLLSNNIYSFFFERKIMTGVRQQPKLQELRLNKSGELEIMPSTGTDLWQILTNFLNERQRRKSLGGSGRMLPMGIFSILTIPKSPFLDFWVIQTEYWPVPSPGWNEALQLGKFFFNMSVMKNLTDFHKAVETGVDPRLY